MKLLFPEVSVDALGHAHHRHVLDPQFGQDFMHRADLPRAAVDQQQVRPGIGLPVGIFLEQALEAPGQHLFHHAEVVAGGQVFALDVELAVLAFDEAVRAGHDHRANRVRALDMAVVVHLDPLRRRVEVEGFGQPRQQFRLGRRLGHLAGQAFAGVAQRAGDQILLLARCGTSMRTLRPALSESAWERRSASSISSDRSTSLGGSFWS